MRAASAALLILGFAVGFFAMNKYITPHAEQMTKPIPQFTPQSAASSGVRKPDPAVIRQLEDVLKNDPKNVEALRELGDKRYDERMFLEAAALYARALEVEPGNVNLRADRGGALLQGGQLDAGISELRTVLATDPTHPQALFVMGLALLNGKNDPVGALANWNKLIQSHPDLPELELVKDQIRQIEEMTRRK